MRIGLAAGYNKSGLSLPRGFDYVVVGTVTRHPRRGNPPPNMRRVYDGLINWVGLTNVGVDELVHNISSLRYEQEIWGSVAGEAIEDVVYCYERLAPHVDRVELNISSPNAVGLHRDPGELSELLEEIGPVVVKLPLTDDAYGLAEVCARRGAEMTVANSRPTPNGGLSGPIIRERAQRMLERICSLYPSVAVHACGGISTPKDIDDVRAAGASTAQIHTAFRLGIVHPLVHGHAQKAPDRR